jgi:hypothetical protein
MPDVGQLGPIQLVQADDRTEDQGIFNQGDSQLEFEINCCTAL